MTLHVNSIRNEIESRKVNYELNDDDEFNRSRFATFITHLESRFIRSISLRALYGMSEVVAMFSAMLNCAD